MEKSLIRWGILSTAQIARKNWKAIRNSGNGIVAAVASRDLERSRNFIAECQAEASFQNAPKPLGTYEELISSKDIDAVYIPLPTGVRKEWVLRAAEAGKHIVCEKPCAITMNDLSEMIGACERNRVQFMDGVMFMHSARLDAIRKVLSETVGQIKRIAAVFNFSAPEEFFKSNIRVQSSLEPHGCVGDLGWYCIRFALWTMNWKLPKQVSGRILSEIKHKDAAASVPTEFSGELFFEGGVSCGFYCSFITELQQTIEISGTRGYLHLPDFVLPFFGDEVAFQTFNPVFNARGCDFNMEPHIRRRAVNEYSNSHPTSQETNLFRHFADQITSGTLDKTWPDMALKTQQVMHACLQSVRTGKTIDL
jgi:predicted dehydrogenase